MLTPITSSNLRAISGVSSNDVWIVGEEGTILHWNNGSLAALPTPIADRAVHSVLALEYGTVWFGADGFFMMSWDGRGFRGVELAPEIPGSRPLRLWGHPSDI